MPAPGAIALIPARMGSQRLRQKNLQLLRGEPLIVHAIRKCVAAACFDEVWVNSEHDAFERIARAEGVGFHRRPPQLASDTATSEEFVGEFLRSHPCGRVFQVHSIAPLLPAARVAAFVHAMAQDACDVMLSCVLEQIECACQGEPVNFTFAAKTNSQELPPVQRVTWCITGWRAATFLNALADGRTATYAGRVAFFPVDRVEGHVIKTERDLRIADALWDLAHGPERV